MMAVRAYCIPRDQIMDYWPRVDRWLDRAYAKTDLVMPGELVDQLQNGDRQLWIAWASEGKILCGVITRLAKRRLGLYCEIEAAGGVEVTRWIGCMTTIQEWAKSEGCSKVTVQGRPGWAMLLRHYRRSQVVLELDL
jgi:hypothetical protein